MKKLTLLGLFLFVFTCNVLAQTLNYTAVPLMDYFRVEQMTEQSVTQTLNESNIQGSPYLEDEFRMGTVYTSSKKKIENIPIRYNAYNDELEFETPNKMVLAVDRPEDIELADFGEYKMTYSEFLTGNTTKRSFFKLLASGNATLLAKSNITFQKAVESDGIKPEKPAQFVSRADKYYLQLGKNPAKVIGNKKELIAMLDDHGNEVTTFIKKNKVKMNKGDHLQMLIEYYNSL